MNLPNKLTILRVIMIPFFVAALLYDGEVVPAHAEFLVLGLGLSELQYLVDEVQ